MPSCGLAPPSRVARCGPASFVGVRVGALSVIELPAGDAGRCTCRACPSQRAGSAGRASGPSLALITASRTMSSQHLGGEAPWRSAWRAERDEWRPFESGGGHAGAGEARTGSAAEDGDVAAEARRQQRRRVRIRPTVARAEWCRCTRRPLCFDLHVPESRSLKAKRAVRPADRRRAAAPVPRVGRRGRPPGPVAAGRDRRSRVVGGERRAPPRAARRPSSGSSSRAPDVELLDVETAWLEPESTTLGVTRRGRAPPRRYPRTLRVNEVVREVLADELERMDDPRLELVTITGVDVSRDLRHATVYYAALGPATSDEIARTRCGAAAPHLRAALGPAGAAEVPPRAATSVEDPAIEHGSARRGDPPRSPRTSRSRATDDEGRERRAATATTRSTPTAAAVDRRAPHASRSRATSTPTATRSARCSALLHVLRAAGRRRRRVVPDAVRRRAALPRAARPRPARRRPSDFPAEPDVMVTFDCGSLGAARRPRARGQGRARARSSSTTTSRTSATARSTSIDPTRPRAACSCAG